MTTFVSYGLGLQRRCILRFSSSPTLRQFPKAQLKNLKGHMKTRRLLQQPVLESATAFLVSAYSIIASSTKPPRSPCLYV
ncbi:hypothetical protein BDV27DRAFT_128533 [Aspergillus caelatus]|uniref:Uncharacterized protein n=1 Tax=Aspergillus caelatus TaxID=61420 RepID=A0A5N7A3B8_9EURO|nr:uncharacterized protein BDV27DRAFT_128533 [Aspergillus caelatus]KAE8364361.1 hypothetical protein BDV27DRAFT_128533 [Aspergillus caelatus]